MSNTIETLDAAGYRKFGLVSGAIVVVLFGLAIPWLFSFNFPRWPWIFAGVLVGWALLLPTTLKPVYIGWMKFGNMMNWINTRILLGIVFYGFTQNKRCCCYARHTDHLVMLINQGITLPLPRRQACLVQQVFNLHTLLP